MGNRATKMKTSSSLLTSPPSTSSPPSSSLPSSPPLASSPSSSSSPSSNDNLISRSITERIGNNYEGTEKWKGIVKGSNNCYYCIPYNAEQILKIDPSNDKTTLVGKKHNGDWKWYNGFAHENFIYCIPYFANQFLKFNVITEKSELVGGNLGNGGYKQKWVSGALANDGCFYCFPYMHNRILKFNPSSGTTQFVGEVIDHFKFSGTVKAKNGYLYGLPSNTGKVVKFNVTTLELDFIGDMYAGCDLKWKDCVIGIDDNIYGVPHSEKRWLKIDITDDTTSLVSNDLTKYGECKYEGGVVGEDDNIYAIPSDANNVIKLNTTTQISSLIGNHYDGYGNWCGGVLHTNGCIYCAPCDNNKVLKIETNHIRVKACKLIESNASLAEFNKYINSNEFENIYVTHKAFYDHIVSYRDKVIIETAKMALE